MADPANDESDSLSAARVETFFLDGVEDNLRNAESWLPGVKHKRFRFDHEIDLDPDEEQGFGGKDEKTYRCSSVVVDCMRRRWLPGNREARIVAAAVSPSGDPGQVSPRDEPLRLDVLIKFLQQFLEEQHPQERLIVGMFSPSGVSEELRESGLNYPNVDVIAIETTPTGEWRVDAVSPSVDTAVRELFDPGYRLRVYVEVMSREADLIAGGLFASSLAREIQIALEKVIVDLRWVAARDAGIESIETEGDLILYKVPGINRSRPNRSLAARIKGMIAGEPNEVRMIRMLTRQRAILSWKRERLFDALAQADRRTRELQEQAESAQSPRARNRFTDRIEQIRKDGIRNNQLIAMIRAQIDLLAADIHNLNLVMQDGRAELPNSEEILDHASAAEELAERIGDTARFAAGLTVGDNEADFWETESAVKLAPDSKEQSESGTPTAPPADAIEPSKSSDKSELQSE
jgi:hypothetical protein